MKEAKVILPFTDGTFGASGALAKMLWGQFRGLTIFDGNGFSQGPDGAIEREPIRAYVVAMDDTPANEAFLCEAAALAGRQAKQREVYVQLCSGQVVYLPPAGQPEEPKNGDAAEWCRYFEHFVNPSHGAIL